jgi:hypothetical protein
MTADALPPSDPRPAAHANGTRQEGVGSTFRNGWRALNQRTLVARKGGRDRMRLPLSIAAILGVVLLWWSWPIVFVAVAIALMARVEFVVVHEAPTV